MKVLVGDRCLIVERERTPAVIETEFDIKTYRSLTRLARILLVDTSEVC